MPRCAFVESQEGMLPSGAQWDDFARRVKAAQPDVLVMNEMPFGTWLASAASYDHTLAEQSIALHDAGSEALAALGVPAIISSRPVAHDGRLVNEAIAIENGYARQLHRKQYFPEEPGWYEASWFLADQSGFEVHEVNNLRIGVLLCTELMFNERARKYGRAGADLIVVPRATGRADDSWTTAAAMAAIVSGSYVVSSNRTAASPASPIFGGCGFAFDPRGALLAETTTAEPLVVIDIDVEDTRRQKREYPCYVVE